MKPKRVMPRTRCQARLVRKLAQVHDELMRLRAEAAAAMFQGNWNPLAGGNYPWMVQNVPVLPPNSTVTTNTLPGVISTGTAIPSNPGNLTVLPQPPTRWW